jgi:hypothetical protein
LPAARFPFPGFLPSPKAWQRFTAFCGFLTGAHIKGAPSNWEDISAILARWLNRAADNLSFPIAVKETLIKSFDKLRTNGKLLIPFVVSLSNHERNQLNQSFLYVTG